jgi:hypothetical protein
MGKTALAGKLCQQLEQQGVKVYAYSARDSYTWSDFVTDLESALAPNLATKYDASKDKITETRQAQMLFECLLIQHQGKVALFLDNLESIQDPKSRELTEPSVKLWLETAHAFTAHGLITILTSRWCLPGWEGTSHHYLEKPAYSDFIAFARQKGLLTALTEQRKSREVYEVLGGNYRAFEFFIKASKDMNLTQTDDFLSTLNQAKEESQTDMALAKIIDQQNTLEKSLLTRLLAYSSAIPIKGISVIALRVTPPLSKKDEHVDAIDNLIKMSLVECLYNNEYETLDYQLAPLVRDYLLQHGYKVTHQAKKTLHCIYMMIY